MATAAVREMPAWQYTPTRGPARASAATGAGGLGDPLVLARLEVDEREGVDRHRQPRRPGLPAQVNQPLGARRDHRHGQPGVAEQHVLVQRADAQDGELGRHAAGPGRYTARPRSITTVPSLRVV